MLKIFIVILLLGLASAALAPVIAAKCPAVQKEKMRTTVKRFRVTAYCPCQKCCGKYADGITASGHKIRFGDRFVAAPLEFRFGTSMLIPFYGTVEVRDRGGKIKGDRLDVFFDTHQKALDWGVKFLDVVIFEAENVA